MYKRQTKGAPELDVLVLVCRLAAELELTVQDLLLLRAPLNRMWIDKNLSLLFRISCY